MTPEEIKEITEIVVNVIESESNSSNGPIYLLISLIVTASPIIARYLRKAHAKETEKVVTKLLEPIDSMISVMEMHIEELSDVKEKQEKLEQSHNEVKKKVEKNTSNIKEIKNNG